MLFNNNSLIEINYSVSDPKNIIRLNKFAEQSHLSSQVLTEILEKEKPKSLTTK